ncbi:MAG: Chemotaxis protein CheR [Bacteroidetes bacterium]|nr:Chemotaxis protein CheR [Bacteroidota bacterium]
MKVSGKSARALKSKTPLKRKKKSLLLIDNNQLNFPVVGIGGSAGSFPALEQFFKNTPENIGMAFIVVIHLDPTKKGLVPELLQRYTKLKVIEAADGMLVSQNVVYIIPPAKDISILNGQLLLFEPTKPRGYRMPIDFFFQSLGRDQRERSAAVILSGMGSDGELGLKVVKEHLGVGLVQDPDSTEFSSMPQAAISTGFTDYILPPEDMPEKLIGYFYHPVIKTSDTGEVTDLKSENALLKVFMLLRTQTGHDFSLYKKSTIIRRIDRRIAVQQLKNISEYVNYLREHPHEIDVLFKELLIGVTKFFRDSEAFNALEKELMEIIKNKKKEEPIRAWVAGCSTGEEAYSIAILLLECIEKVKPGHSFKIQVFATDLDSAAIEKARTGIYYDNVSGDVSPERLKRFFIHQNNHYIVKKEIRELIVFAQHNIIRDSPFTKLDLLCCRNLLIYLNSDLQRKLIPLFHFSLNKDGILFLGNSETIGTFNDLFFAFNPKLRIFGRRDAPSFVKFDYPFSIPRHEITALDTLKDLPRMYKNTLPEVFQGILLEKYTPPSLIMNEKGDVLYVNGNLGKFVEITTGEPQMNIHKIAKKGIRYELSNLVAKAVSNESTEIREDLSLKTGGQTHRVKITCCYMTEPVALEGLLMLVFEDQGIRQPPVPAAKNSGTHEDAIIIELEKELAYVRKQLQTTVQQMETSFEELKSTNEELQSTNEELQSTNEESISSKEEMQSLNEELMTVNMQYKEKSEELIRINDDMKNLMDSMEIAIVFLDNELVIKRYTPKAAEIIQLIPSDVGRPLSNLSSTLIYKGLEKDMKAVIDKLIPKEISIRTVHDQWYSLRITPYRTSNNFIEGIVLSFIDITQLKELENRLNELLVYAEGIVNGISDSLVVVDSNSMIVSANNSFKKTFRLSDKDIVGMNLFRLQGWNITALKKKLEGVSKSRPAFKDFPVSEKFPGAGKNSTFLIDGRLIDSKNKEKAFILLTIRPDTPSKKK